MSTSNTVVPSSPEELSDRQKKIITYMQEFVATKGFSPSYREISDATGISSTSVVAYNIEKLVEQGYLMREDKQARSIRLLSSAKKTDTRYRRRAERAEAELSRAVAEIEELKQQVASLERSLKGINQVVMSIDGIKVYDVMFVNEAKAKDILYGDSIYDKIIELDDLDEEDDEP